MAHENLSNQVLRCHVLQHPLIWYANQILNTGDDSWLDQTYWFDPSVSIMVSIKIVLFLFIEIVLIRFLRSRSTSLVLFISIRK